jgi:FixJ family two-component response regulator
MDLPVVYVVDDDPSVRVGLQRLLRSGGHKVRLFASAEQFLANADSGARGCLILDLMLPGMSGLELQERLASHGWELPVIFITSHYDAASHDAALRKGALAYLCKPFGCEQILASVRGAIDAQASSHGDASAAHSAEVPRLGGAGP